jgi:hypothetical protein
VPNSSNAASGPSQVNTGAGRGGALVHESRCYTAGPRGIVEDLGATRAGASLHRRGGYANAERLNGG